MKRFGLSNQQRPSDASSIVDDPTEQQLSTDDQKLTSLGTSTPSGQLTLLSPSGVMLPVPPPPSPEVPSRIRTIGTDGNGCDQVND